MSLTKSLATIAGVAVLTSVAMAQITPCYQPDGYSLPGACCATPQVNLPQFPAFFNIPTDAACFTDCIPQTFQEKLTIQAPSQLFCDIYITNVSLTGPATIAPSLLVMKYTRTWEEIDPVSHRQIWRFLVNGDLSYLITTASTSPCPIPATAMAGMPVHFIGSVDYARDCNTGNWSIAYNITHLCGDFMHNGLSANPITPNPNPNHMYTFAGPAPFVFAPGPIPAGNVIADAVRSVNWNFTVSPLQWDCKTDVPVFQGQLSNVLQYCACAIVGNPFIPAWTQQKLTFNYQNCTGAIDTWSDIPWAPLLPTGLSVFSIGRYVGPFGTYPSGEQINLYFGVSQSPDPCANNFPVHLVMGMGTVSQTQGWVNATAAGGPVPTNQFLDLEDMMILIGGPPFIAIGVGGLFLSPMLWSLNF